jgi:hypothetical protein
MERFPILHRQRGNDFRFRLVSVERFPKIGLMTGANGSWTAFTDCQGLFLGFLAKAD